MSIALIITFKPKHPEAEPTQRTERCYDRPHDPASAQIHRLYARYKDRPDVQHLKVVNEEAK